MIHAIWRQAKADLLSRRGQSALILLTIASAAALLTMGVVTLSSVQQPFERTFEARGEVIVGEGLLEWTGKSPGDDLVVSVNDQTLTLHIVGTYLEMNNLGRMAMGGLDTLRQAVPDAEAQGYHIKVQEDTDVQALVTAIEKASDGRLLGEAVDTTPPGEILRLRVVVGSLAAALNLIALVSIFNATWMAVRERIRDFGVFKAVGMTPAQVTATVLVGAGALVVIVTLVGLPVGVWATHAALVGLGRMFGFPGTIPLAINWIGLALVPIGALAIAALGSALPARWAARMKVAEVLRYE